MMTDITGIPLCPGNSGKNCLGNGLHPGYECCCDECDYLLCCAGIFRCEDCNDESCPNSKN